MVGGGPQPARKAPRRLPDSAPLLVWLGRVDDWDEEAAVPILSPDERRRYERFRRAEDRRTYAVSHAALRLVLGDLLDTAPDHVVIQPDRCLRCGGPHGKPEVATGALQFNLTHSGRMFGVAVHPQRSVGIDVQEVTDAPVIDLARRFFTLREHELLCSLPVVERSAAFARIWSRKEAVLKAAGRSIAGGLDEFLVPDGQPTEVTLTNGVLYTVTDLTVPEGYGGAVAAAGAADATTVDSRWIVGPG